MARLYLYAVIDGRPPRGARGIAGERLELFSLGPCAVAFGAMGTPPPLDAAALRAHHALVARLAARAPALLPFRFGSLADDEDAARATLEPRRAELAAALDRVRGREQMTLRVFAAPGRRGPRVAPAPPREPLETGPGARWLAARAREGALPEIDPVRAALAPLVCAEILERPLAPARGPAPLVASVHHLIPRGCATEYAHVVAAALPASLRARASGPFPAYAFARETT